MIQQSQYTAATSKYNFPPTSLEDTTLPQRFLELSIRSIKTIQNGTTSLYQPYETLTEETFNASTEVTPTFQGQTTLKPKPIRLKPQPDQTPVIAIDVSSIKIGETTTGTLLALRAATVWKQEAKGYRYLRLGPFPFHITEENKNEIVQLFQQYGQDEAQPSLHAASVANILQTQTRMTTLLERWLQTQISHQAHSSIILLDGSLTAGTSDTPTQTLSQLLATARSHGNTVLAFTKITRLRQHGIQLTDLIQKAQPPSLLQMEGYPTTAYNHIHFLGTIYVAKLSPSPCAFRLDIDNTIPNPQAISAVQRLIANDLITDSYPETLRLAHIYSTFTANEVIGIQRFLTQTYGLRIIQRPNIRRILFGPYAKGPPEA